MHRREPAERVDEDREEAEDGGDHDLRPRAERPEPGVRDRCERDHRDRVRGDQVRDERATRAAASGRARARRAIATELPRTKPAERLLERDPAAVLSASRSSHKRAGITSENRGSRKLWTAEDVGKDPLPADEAERRRRRAPGASSRATPAAVRIGAGRGGDRAHSARPSSDAVLDAVESSRAPR